MPLFNAIQYLAGTVKANASGGPFVKSKATWKGRLKYIQ